MGQITLPPFGVTTKPFSLRQTFVRIIEYSTHPRTTRCNNYVLSHTLF